MQRAEKDRQIIEEKVKLWKTPVGLARPVQPNVNPLVTHRGQGAFCDRDFLKKPSVTEPPPTEESPTKKEISDDTFDENSERETMESDRSENNNENETRFENATDDSDNKYDQKEESNVAAEKNNGDEAKSVTTDDADISVPAKANDNAESGISYPQDKHSPKTNVNNSYLGDTKSDLDTKIAQELANFERKTEDQGQNLSVKDDIKNGNRDNHSHKETDQKLDSADAGDQAEVSQETKDVNCNDKLESKPDIGPEISCVNGEGESENTAPEAANEN